MRIGYIGLGSMGGALARRLIGSHEVLVFDRNEKLMVEMANEGAITCPSLREMVRCCDVMFLCLPTSDHVDAVIFGENGLAQGLRAGQILIDQTTGFPEATRAMAAQLSARGVTLIDAPVSGGPKGALAGTIAIMVGGHDAAFKKVQPILASISPNITYAGGSGSGHALKLVNNMVSFTQRLLTYEALALGTKNGLSPEVIVEVLGQSTAQNGYINRVYKPKVMQGDLNIGFTLGLTLKDMVLADELGKVCEVPLPLTRQALQLYEAFATEVPLHAEVETLGLIAQKLSNTHFIPEV